MRVEDAVDKFLYWDEEVTLIEAVTTEMVSGRGFQKQALKRVLTSKKTIFTCFFDRFFNFILTLCPQGSPEHHAKADSPTDDSVYDDSGVSDITSSSERSSGHGSRRGLDHMTSHMTADDSAQSSEDASSSEKWALVSHAPSQLTPSLIAPSQASKYCADAKDYLEMMCRDLSSELNQFDLQKELELKQVLMDYATRQLERHEKVFFAKQKKLF